MHGALTELSSPRLAGALAVLPCLHTHTEALPGTSLGLAHPQAISRRSELPARGLAENFALSFQCKRLFPVVCLFGPSGIAELRHSVEIGNTADECQHSPPRSAEENCHGSTKDYYISSVKSAWLSLLPPGPGSAPLPVAALGPKPCPRQPVNHSPDSRQHQQLC